MQSAEVKKTIIIWCYWGPEVRLIVYSKLLHRLLASHRVILMSRVVDAAFMEKVPAECEVIQIPPIDDRRLYSLTNMVNSSHKRTLQRKGFKLGLKTNAGTGPTKNRSLGSKLRMILSSAIPTRILLILEELSYKWCRKDYAFLTQSIECPNPVLLTMDPVSCGSLMMSHCISAFGGKTVLFFPNWKDLARGFRCRRSYHNYLLWNEEMLEDLTRQNNDLNIKNISITGTPQFELNRQFNNEEVRGEVLKALNLQEEKPIILYTAASKRVIPFEGEILNVLCEKIQREEIVNSPQLVVRLNPTGSDPTIPKLAEKFPFMRISEPKWDFRPEQPGGFWQSTDPEDVKLYGCLLHACSFGIGAPSTVVVDLANAGKRMVAIGFDPPGKPVNGRSVTTFSSQDIFQSAMHFNAAILAEDPEELVKLSNHLLLLPQENIEKIKLYDQIQTGSSETESVERIIEAINRI